MSAKPKAMGKKPGGLSDRASDIVLVLLSVFIMLLAKIATPAPSARDLSTTFTH